MQHVEIRHRRLHHDHVRAFFQIEFDLAHGLAQVRRVHLVGAAIAEVRRRIGRFAERPIEAAGKLRRVGEYGDVLETVLVERGANGGHAAVHHVGRAR